MKYQMIEIDLNTYIPLDKILIVVANDKKSSAKKIKCKAKEENALYKLAQNPSSLIKTIDGDVYMCDSNPDTIIKKCADLEYNFLNVDESSYVAMSHIKVLTTSDSPMVSGLRKKLGKTAGDLQFVHQNDKRRSVILLKNDQLVYLSKDSRDIINNSAFGVSEKASEEK